MKSLKKLQEQLRERDITTRQGIQRWRRYRIKYRTVEALRDRPKQFAKFAFPIIQNMPQGDLVEQLVAVQPMNLPAANVFYMDIQGRRENYTRRRRLDDGVNVLEHGHDDNQIQAARRVAGQVAGFRELYGGEALVPGARAARTVLRRLLAQAGAGAHERAHRAA